jgi:hypothetical protein
LNLNKKEEEYMRESIKYFHVKQDAMDKSVDGVSWKTNSEMLDEQVKLDKLMTEILAVSFYQVFFCLIEIWRPGTAY